MAIWSAPPGAGTPGDALAAERAPNAAEDAVATDLVTPVGFGARQWLLLALAYPLCWLLGYQASTEYWFVPAGLRLACLLRLPQRQWGALFALEVATIAGYEALLGNGYASVYGALLGMPAPFLVYAAAIALWRRWHPGRTGTTPRAAAALMAVTMMAALAVAALLGAMRLVEGIAHWRSVPQLVLDYAIGDYVAALIVAPLLIQVGLPGAVWRRAALLWQVAATLLPLALVLAAARLWLPQTVTYFALLAMVPPVWMAFRGGWRGATLALAGSSVIVYLFTPPLGEGSVPPSVLQMYLAVVGSVALMLGAWVAVEGLLRGRLLHNNALLLEANRHLEAGREEMRALGERLVAAQESERARIRDELSGDLGQAISALAGQLALLSRKLDQPEQFALLDGMRVRMQQVRDIADDCIERLQPLALERRPLADALSDNALARALEQMGADYQVQVSGQPDALDTAARLAVYRVVQHVVAAMLRRGDGVSLHVAVDIDASAAATVVELRCVLRFRALAGPAAFADQADARALRDRVLALGGDSELRAIDGHALQYLARFPLRGRAAVAGDPLRN